MISGLARRAEPSEAILGVRPEAVVEPSSVEEAGEALRQASSGGNIARRDFVVDRTAPNVSIDSGPSGTVDADTVTFTFSSNEPGSTYDCQLDLNAFAGCGSLKATYSGLVPTDHIFTVRATDAVSNASSSVRSFKYVPTPPGHSSPGAASSPHRR